MSMDAFRVEVQYRIENEVNELGPFSTIWKLSMVRQEAWRFLQGASPCWVRQNQPPISSLAGEKEMT
jgi:hypothetical protein